MYKVLTAGLLVTLLANACASLPKHHSTSTPQPDNSFPVTMTECSKEVIKAEILKFYDYLSESGQLVQKIDPAGIFETRVLDEETLKPVEDTKNEASEEVKSRFDSLLSQDPGFQKEWAANNSPPL